jgi:hypothetical protein
VLPKTMPRFVELDFPGILHKKLIGEEGHDYRKLRHEIEGAWELAPQLMKDRFIQLSGTDYVSYRGLIFELYILKKLHDAGFEIQYEVNLGGQNSKMDFLAIKGKAELLVEVTSIGPNELGRPNPNYDIDPESYKNLRSALKAKLGKDKEPPGMQAILAICNSRERFLGTKFEKVQTLYGLPAVRFDRKTSESQMVLSDKGIWAEHSHEARGFSGVYFTQGIYPGFTWLPQPEIWLYPMAEYPLELGLWPEDVIYFNSSEDLFTTSKSKEYLWHKVASIFS